MRKEVVETGKSVELVIEAACEKLGCGRDECEWEIVELPKKSFLGLKTTPAKVRVWIDQPEEEKPQKPQAEQRETPKPREQAPRTQQPQREQRPPRQERKEPPKPAPRREQPEEVQNPGENHPAKVALAEEYIRSILQAYKLDATLRTDYHPDGTCINIEGQGLGMIIGRRGETLDSIQYLAGLVANRLEGDYLRVTVDCGDYRAKRRETLEALAKKLAGQVLKTNISKTLEPMNPFERRIIHATVSELEGVSSLSIGEEPNRRVVITSPTARSSRGPSSSRSGGPRGRSDRDRGDRRPPRSGGPRREFDRDRDRDRRRNPSPRPSAPPAEQGPPKQTPEAKTENPLYAKIDLD